MVLKVSEINRMKFQNEKKKIKTNDILGALLKK